MFKIGQPGVVLLDDLFTLIEVASLLIAEIYVFSPLFFDLESDFVDVNLTVSRASDTSSSPR